MTGGLPRRLAAALIVSTGTFLVCAIFSIGLSNKSATDRDYIQYWAAGHLLAEHANPYNLQRFSGLSRQQDSKARIQKLRSARPLL